MTPARPALLLLSHRFPYPPDRGEKIRLWHVLLHLARDWRIFLGCLSDSPRDQAHRATVETVCAGLGCFSVQRRSQTIAALLRARPGRPLMLDFYGHAGLRRWVADRAASERFDAVFAYSTAMAPYGLAVPARRRILDMVDVDSEKWAAYAETSGFPARLVWAREARTLRRTERRMAARYDRTLLVTEAECRRFVQLAPDCAGRVQPMENGVDLAGFDPGAAWPNPYPDPGPWLVLVGNMDYRPNDEAARWFVDSVLPRLSGGDKPPRLAVVGANPGPALLRLAGPRVLVTGRVADVRPWIAHADAVVAPLLLARGVQNKVLEGMAMARPVIASPPAFEGIRATPGQDLLVAGDAAAMAARVTEVLDGRHPGLGAAARATVERNYAWSARLAELDALLRPAD